MCLWAFCANRIIRRESNNGGNRVDITAPTRPKQVAGTNTNTSRPGPRRREKKAERLKETTPPPPRKRSVTSPISDDDHRLAETEAKEPGELIPLCQTPRESGPETVQTAERGVHTGALSGVETSPRWRNSTRLRLLQALPVLVAAEKLFGLITRIL